MQKNPILFAEELVLPAALDLVSTMLGESVAQELKLVPLSNNTICRRIDKIADDINDQLGSENARKWVQFTIRWGNNQ